MNQWQLLISCILVSLIGAIFLRLAVKLVRRFDISYWYCFKLTIIAYIMAFVLHFVLTDSKLFAGTDPLLLLGASAAGEFLISALIFGIFIKTPQPLGILKGTLVAIIVWPLSAITISVIYFGCCFLPINILFPK